MVLHYILINKELISLNLGRRVKTGLMILVRGPMWVKREWSGLERVTRRPWMEQPGQPEQDQDGR